MTAENKGSVLRAVKAPLRRFIIKGKLEALNDYTSANRGNKYAGQRMKAQQQEIIGWSIKMGLGKWKTDKPVNLHFTWIEPNRKRDKDNIAFAKKFIIDALVAQRVLVNDGWKYVHGFTDSFEVDKDKPRVIVEIEEVS